MNVFASDKSPYISAINLDKKRVIKMTLESTQLLSTAIYLCGGNNPYLPNHINHPCSRWVRLTRNNFKWLYMHYLCLCNLYKKAYKKEHKCYLLKNTLKQGFYLIPVGKLTDFANCTGIKENIPIEEKYKKYLLSKWTNGKRKVEWIIKPKWLNLQI